MILRKVYIKSGYKNRKGGPPGRPLSAPHALLRLRRGRPPGRPAPPHFLLHSVGATLAVAHGRGRAPPLRTTRYAFVGAGGCPPSCQPIPGHCRVRQSGHFLETASLLLPLAALRRFPRRPEPVFSRTHGRAHGPCPTRRCVIGPGRTGPSAPIRPLSPGWY